MMFAPYSIISSFDNPRIKTMDIGMSSHNPFGFNNQYVTYQSHNEGIDEGQTSIVWDYSNREHSRCD